jgi:predicted nucleic acid-binding protein
VRRVVIDTNVLVSHLLGGKPRQVVSLWYVGLIELCLSDDILAEYARVLARIIHGFEWG